MQHIQP